jgi:serine/threonine-protein kinase
VTGGRPTAVVTDLSGSAAGGAAASGPAGRFGTAVMPLPPLGVDAARARTTQAAATASGNGRRALVRVALGALVVLVLLAAGIGLLQNVTGSTAAPPSASTPPSAAMSSAPASTSPAAVQVTAADYVGKKVTDVQAALAAKGLRVTLTKVTTAATAAGLVTAVTPTGALPPGSAVTVTYAAAPVAVAPAPPPAPAGGGGGHKKHGKGKAGG